MKERIKRMTATKDTPRAAAVALFVPTTKQRRSFVLLLFLLFDACCVYGMMVAGTGGGLFSISTPTILEYQYRTVPGTVHAYMRRHGRCLPHLGSFRPSQ